MRPHLRPHDRGAALVLVLVCLLALSSLVLATTKRAFLEAQRSSYLKGEHQADLLMESLLLLALERIAQDEEPQDDTWFDPWAAPIEGEFFTMTIEPCNAQLNLNKVNVSEPLADAVNSLGLELNATGQFLGSLKDWVDEDNKGVAFGDEQTPYKQLWPRYTPPNRPLLVLEELFLVSGWDAVPPSKVEKLFTVWGREAKVNVNFAPEEVMQALLPETSYFWEGVRIQRQEQGIRSIEELLEAAPTLGANKDLLDKATQLICFNSELLRVMIEVHLPNVYEKRRYIVRHSQLKPKDKKKPQPKKKNPNESEALVIIKPSVVQCDVLEVRPADLKPLAANRAADTVSPWERRRATTSQANEKD